MLSLFRSVPFLVVLYVTRVKRIRMSWRDGGHRVAGAAIPFKKGVEGSCVAFLSGAGAMSGVWAMVAMEVDVRGRAELLRGMAASRLSRLEVDYPSEWD